MQMWLGVINAFIFGVFLFFIGNIVYDKKYFFTKRNFIALSIYMIGFLLNIYFFTPMFSIFFYYILIVAYQKIVFRNSLYKTLLGALIAYLSRLTIEFIIIALGLFPKNLIYMTNQLSQEKFILQLITVSLAILFIFIFRKSLKKIIDTIERVPTKQFLILFLIYLLFVIIIVVRIPTITFNQLFVADFSIISLIIVIAFLIINREHKTESIHRFYDEISIYSKLSESLIAEYRMVLHEYKNQLAVIYQMLKEDSKDLEDYIKTIINIDQELKYEWLSELSYLPIPAWKGFVSYKIGQMKEIGIYVELVISPELSNTSLLNLTSHDKNDLYMITGILLDNAREAAIESEEKIVSLQLYCFDDVIHFEIANTFSRKIDIEKIGNYGYSSKGLNHGTGLFIIKALLEKNTIYKLKSSLLDEFFIQHVTITPNLITENHKK